MKSRHRPLLTRIVMVALGGALVAGACSGDATESAEYRALLRERDTAAAALDAATTRIEELEVDLRNARARTTDDETRLAAWEEFAGTSDAGVWPQALLDAHDSGCSGNSATYAECSCYTQELRDNVPLMDMILINELAFAAQVGTVDLDPGTGFPVGMPVEAIEALDAAAAKCAEAAPPVTTPVVETGNPVLEGAPLARFVRDGADPAVGMKAPEVAGADFAGTPQAIRHEGTPKAVLFLAHWCSHCRTEVPLVAEWLRQTGGVAGTTLISVASAIDPGAPNYPSSAWLEREGWPAAVIVDDAQSSTYLAYGAGGFPYWVFVDGAGTVLARHEGALAVEDLEAFLGTLTG